MIRKWIFLFMLPFFSAAGGVLQLADSPVLSIRYQGHPLVLEEGVVFSPAADWRKNVKMMQSIPLPGYRVVQNVRMDVPELSMRREAAESSDGNCIEIGLAADVPAYFQTSDGTFGYHLELDFSRFQGMKYTAFCGRSNKRQEFSGTISPDMPNGHLGKDGALSVLIVEQPGGGSLVFDFNPEGVSSYSDHGPNDTQGLWQVFRRGDRMIFAVGRSLSSFGGAVLSRMRIYPGGKKEWMRRHARMQFGYFSVLPVERAYSFTPGKAGKMYSKGQMLYRKGAKAGWVKTLPEQILSRKTGALYGAAAGKPESCFTYRISGIPESIGYFTLRFVSYDKATGPFSVKIAGREVLKGKTLPPHTAGDLTAACRTPEGDIDLEFSGDFRLAAILFQPLVRIQEDLKVFRAFWLAKGLYEPSVMNRSEYYAKVPEFKADFSEMPLPPGDTDLSQTGRSPVREKALCSGTPEKMAFRNQGTITSLGPGNNGTFAEYAGKGALTRRMDELQKDGASAIIVNGFLSRHLFREHFPRVYAQMKKITAEAHKRNIKVIDHQDLTLLWNCGSGLRNLVSETDHLLHSIRTGVPNTGYCLNNPGFRKEFFDRFEKEIREADLDGMMLDEVSFFDPEFCGCRHCRKLFTEQTGLVLPMDETLLEKNWRRTALGRAWSDFRLKSVGDFFVEMRRRAEKVKKEFTLMVYTTHYGWGSTYATMTQGHSLAEAVRGCDFAGTEIMSRNVIASRRPVMAYRKMKNALNFEYGCPVFGLVYPGNDADIAFCGWALNYMNAQTTWFSRKLETDCRFISFAGGTDRLKQHPAAHVGILFSFKSKDYAVNFSYTQEPLGLSELLTDLRIDHRFLLDESLTQEKLQNFKALIAPGCSNLTDREISTLLEFARRGGKLFLTAHSGCCDALGNYRKVWPFQKPLGLALKLPLKPVRTEKLRMEGKELNIGKIPMLRAVRKKNAPGSLLASAVRGKAEIPFAVKVPCGKGEIIWCAARLGDALCESESTVGRVWNYAPDAVLKQMAAKLLKEEFGAYALFDAPQLPERFLTSCTQDRKDGKRRLALHLLNGTDRKLAVGEKIPASAPEGLWKAPEREIPIRFPDLAAARVTLESPDFPEKRELKFRTDGKNTEVILRPEDVKRFSIIVLEEK